MSIGLAIGGIATGVGMLGAAKMQSGAAGRGAQITTDAALRAAELQRQSNMDQLDYLRNQDRIDRESKQWTDRQNYGLSKAEMMNASAQYNDTGVNRRNELVARNLTDDRLYGENQKQFNTMRQMMGMPYTTSRSCPTSSQTPRITVIKTTVTKTGSFDESNGSKHYGTLR